MLAAPCIPPATGSVFSCILSWSKGFARTVSTRRCFVFSQALFRRLPDGRLLVVIQHVLRECQVGMGGLGGWGDCGDGGDGPAPPPRASPCGLAALARVPLTLKRRGTVWVPACAGGGSSALCPAPSPPRAYPASIASLARAPFAGSERGRAFPLAPPFWIPACAGMTRRGGNDGGGMACPRRPGHPPAVSLRSPASPLR